MACRNVVLDAAAREKLLMGSRGLADALRVTPGPKSKSILIERKWGAQMDRSVATLLAAVLLLELGSGLQGVLVPLRADLAGYPAPLIGALGTGYYVGFVIGCLGLPRTVRRVGHIRSFAALAAVAGSVVLGHTFTTLPAVWLPLRVLFGICFAGLFMVTESWLNNRATTQTRGSVLGLYMVATWVGLILGKLLLAAAPLDSFQPFAICAITISLALVPVALTNGAAPAIPTPGRRLGLPALFRLAPVALVGTLAVGVANGAFWTFGPIHAAARTGSTAGVSLFMALCALGGAVIQWPLGRVSDKVDRRWVLLLTCLAAGAAALPLATLADLAGWRLYALGTLFGAAALPAYALCLAHANDRADPADFVEVGSLILLCFGLGAVLGPLLAGLLVARHGSGGVFAFTAAIHFALALLLAARMAIAARVPQAERSAFAPQAPVSHGTQVVIDLMPLPTPPPAPADTADPPSGPG